MKEVELNESHFASISSCQRSVELRNKKVKGLGLRLRRPVRLFGKSVPYSLPATYCTVRNRTESPLMGGHKNCGS